MLGGGRAGGVAEDVVAAYVRCEESIFVWGTFTDEQFREIEGVLGYPPLWLGRHKGWSGSYSFAPRPGHAERTLAWLRERQFRHTYTVERAWLDGANTNQEG